MYSFGMALFFVLVVAIANFLLGFAVAVKLGRGPKNWESIGGACGDLQDDEDAFAT